MYSCRVVLSCTCTLMGLSSTHGGMEMGQGLHTKMVQVHSSGVYRPGAHREKELLYVHIIQQYIIVHHAEEVRHEYLD